MFSMWGIHITRPKYELQLQPFFSQDGKMLLLMQGAEVLPWHLVHPSVYDNLMLWYVMSVDSLVVIDHKERNSLDAVILQ